MFFFLPGGMGIAFMKQYAQSGVGIPVMGPGFSFSQDVLRAIGDAALGVKNSASWAKDLDNAANKKFVEAFKAEYNRLPSIYAAQAWDTANLILSALAKASVKDKDAFRAALKAAEFESVRGKFKFNTNNHPIQNIYVREVVKEGDVLTNKIVATAFDRPQGRLRRGVQDVGGRPAFRFARCAGSVGRPSASRTGSRQPGSRPAAGSAGTRPEPNRDRPLVHPPF